MRRNRLHAETSAYLLQHAGNPVDWYPWAEEALARARAEDKPILLSVGYSACHWCHVMAHESFEDADTAALMNALFVNIKVDREERPDLDKIYQVAQQLITQRAGGWPLTMFLSADDQLPFFGGTYFPKEAAYGLPAFGDLLRRVADYHRNHRAEIGAQAEPLRRAFAEIMPPGGPPSSQLDRQPLDAARAALAERFDARYGGFGAQPKFPHAAAIERALRHWRSTCDGAEPDLEARGIATLTLTRMAEGGIYDQLGGGFFRYSVDRAWMIPHFEKMLYDNGVLLALYANAHLATGEPLFARAAAQTADWALREMRSSAGGFYSSLDADSAGREGQYYAWTAAEIESLLSSAQYVAFAARFGLERSANFDGRWHLHATEAIDAIAARLQRTPAAAAAQIDAARSKLLGARAARVRPARDEKILTAWNALLIKGLAIASRVLDRPDLAAAATAAADFVRTQLWRDGRLLATYQRGAARLPAYLDDYAFMADALFELLQTRWRGADLQFLEQLVEALLEKFADREVGGFFFTACDHERLIHRSKSFADESMPSGNGVAAGVLCRLGRLLGEPRYLEAARRTLTAGLPMMMRSPAEHMSLLNALEDALQATQIVIIRGGAEQAAHWARELGRVYAPSRLLLAIPDDAPGLPRALADKRAAGGTVAYLCSGTACSAPIEDLGEIARALGLRVRR
ncbi:MAG TPA: thioredoxin domain-containing protein [Steroidobacteraceae bacterium]|nr:thioredoxin domain-containing protein [Steroidobacteraceae bacterium]